MSRVHEAVLAAGEMMGKVIAEASKAGGPHGHCELCEWVMQTFAAAYGAEAGVAALKWIPLGGLYIAGGLAPKNLELLQGKESAFMTAFHDKGRVSPLLRRVPVYAVLSEDIGERGAHLVAFRLLIKLQAEALAKPPTPLGPKMLKELGRSATEFSMRMLSPAWESAQALIAMPGESPSHKTDAKIDVLMPETFEAVKHSYLWKGSYARTITVSADTIVTRDPSTGEATNNTWPMADVLEVAPVEHAKGHAVALKVRSRLPLFCGAAEKWAAKEVTFSLEGEAQRAKLLARLGGTARSRPIEDGHGARPRSTATEHGHEARPRSTGMPILSRP